ncbi:cytoplasm protein [Treponema primitia ZAS-2]|uniref:Cytoplasm protein n=1 Tax=Treponema primitia (strain ATCC BAA-887 / DSM 12427 / ZAS-2) TaxID=545694 RepID=F5YLF2_TREPZ|nr:cellulase family glycosylhydrolase [Treponema primitia]AEF86563.1 cytoplasm protein [Treponema primitia ZAS-2]
MDIVNQKLKDEQGRQLLFRGCNLGGSSKNPLFPDFYSQGPESLKNAKEISFIGRPFPLEEAESHLERLRCWGFTLVRFIINWEALEHAGPGIYDEAYLAYLRKVLKLAEEKGIFVYMDPHQDVWSRWTGGDGAPAWTMEKLGMDLDRLEPLGAALTKQRYAEFHRGPYPRMAWPTNYNRYGAATMFTLFFAGNTYAPETKIDGESAQDWLQERYLACMRHCFRRLKNCKAIIGWGTMNEPHPGFIGYKNLEGLENYAVATGPIPGGFQAMAAASGHRVSVPVYSTGIRGQQVVGHETINPEGLSLFREGFSCPWKQAGVWSDQDGEPRLLRKDHFALYQGRPANFVDDFLKPFMLRFTERMRDADEKTLIFIEGTPAGAASGASHPSWAGDDSPGVVNAFHWYDGPTLFTKFFRPWLSIRTDTGKLILGRKKVAAYFAEQLSQGVVWAREHMGNMPCLLGEFGLPFDMNGKRAFKTGDYHLHEEALSMYYDAIDKNLLHALIWNYTADNTHENGDGWNGEDLSIYSEGKGRAVAGWLRPYPMATAGEPLEFTWDRKKGKFRYRFQADPAIGAPTEIFAPKECFGTRVDIALIREPSDSEPSAAYAPDKERVLLENNGYRGVLEITISR